MILRRLGLAALLMLSGLCIAQNTWDKAEIDSIIGGVAFDVSQAIEKLKEKGVTPYDFGHDLYVTGNVDDAIRWYETLGVATKDPQYIYGLARIKWKTGDNHGSLKDGHYLLHKNPSPILRARTLYLLGIINVDERRFDKARKDLQGAFDTYGSIKGKFGGQYLALSMMAWAAVIEGQYDEVEPLIDRALEFNEKLRTIDLEPYGLGFTHEIYSEMLYRQGDYQGALLKAEVSEKAYREEGRQVSGDMLLAKIGLLNFLSGEPKAAGEIATELWERYHLQTNMSRLLAYNEVTLMKLDLCAKNFQTSAEREKAVRAWASSSAGGQALIELLEFVKKKVPCPVWR